MPLCRKCGVEKDAQAFAWRWMALGIRQPVCKACRKPQNAQWYERHGDEHRVKVKLNTAAARERGRAFVWDYLSKHPCVDCGEFDPAVLEFDHVRGQKFKDVSKLVAEGYGVETITHEIGKRDVRCANCHRKKTARDRGRSKGP